MPLLRPELLTPPGHTRITQSNAIYILRVKRSVPLLRPTLLISPGHIIIHPLFYWVTLLFCVYFVDYLLSFSSFISTIVLSVLLYTVSDNLFGIFTNMVTRVYGAGMVIIHSIFITIVKDDDDFTSIYPCTPVNRYKLRCKLHWMDHLFFILLYPRNRLFELKDNEVLLYLLGIISFSLCWPSQRCNN